MFNKIFKYVIRFKNSVIGKALIMGAIREYTKSNDNECTREIMDAIEKML